MDDKRGDDRKKKKRGKTHIEGRVIVPTPLEPARQADCGQGGGGYAAEWMVTTYP